MLVVLASDKVICLVAVAVELERLEVMPDLQVGQHQHMDIGQERVVLEDRQIFQFLAHLFFMLVVEVQELKILLSRINLLP